MLIKDDSLIRIALAGHTGAGKTTLITTFRKAPSGEIGDQGNTTKHAKSLDPKNYESLQAIFVDCPGFQNATMMSQYLKAEKRGSERLAEFIEDCRDDGVDLTYDKRAFDELKASDVVLFVANAEKPADNSDIQEIKLIQKIQRRIVCVLNKLNSLKSEEKRVRRIKQWKDALQEVNINYVIDFDAHWDKPSKITNIYNSISDILTLERKKIFSASLQNFYDRQRKIEKKAYELLSEVVMEIRIKKLEYKDQGDSSETQKKIKKELMDFLEKSIENFILRVTKLYEIAAENLKLPPDNFPLEYKTYTKGAGVLKRLGHGAIGGGVGTGLGALAVGAGVAAFTFFTGGTGAVIVGAALAGAGYGATGGAAVGTTVGVVSAEDTVYKLDIESSELPKNIAEYCLTVIYAVSHHGYGGNPNIDEELMPELLSQVTEFNKNNKHNINWSTAEKADIHEWCQETLQQLEI